MRAFITIVLTLTVTVFIACAAPPAAPPKPSQKPPAETPPSPELQIVSHSMSHDEYDNSIVEGIAKNTGASEVAELKVGVKFYDAEGNLVDSSADYIEHVGGGETCKFCVHGLPAESYKIAIFKTR